MRSTKDLKEIVTSVRTKSNMNGIAGTPQDVLGDTAYTESTTDYAAPLKEWKDANNQNTTDKQGGLRKEYNKLLKEHDSLKRQYNEMKRNLQSMSNFAHSDKADQFRLSQIKQEYEKMIAELKKENGELLQQNTEMTEEIKQSKIITKDQATKIDNQAKEIDKLMQELKKKDKMHEEKIKMINSKYLIL